MRRMIITGLLITVWLVSFVFCLVIPLYFKRDIPSNFSPLIKQAFDTFSPALAVMVAFVFAERKTSTNSGSQDNVSQSLLADILAPVLSLMYVGLFDTIMIMFAIGRLRANETVELFQDYRPYLAFLVNGMIAYYFGSKNHAKRINKK